MKLSPIADELYLQGLNLYLDGQPEEALRVLTECARADSEKVDAFYHAGNLFREMGKADRAERVHNELLMRPSLSTEFRRRTELALVKDYIAQKKYAKAESLLERSLESGRHPLVLEALLRIYEETREWDKALEIQSELEKIKGYANDKRHALYCLESGKALASKDGHAARLKFKEALKKDPDSPWPLILIADSYFQAERVDDALEFWSKFFDRFPKQAHLLFERIEKFYFEGGAYHEVGRIYRELLEREPGSADAMLALAGYLAKRGEREEAMLLCRKVLELKPTSREAQAELLHQVLDGSHSYEEVKSVVRDLLKMYPSRKRYRCSACGQRTETPSWRCTACGRWNPYEL